MKFNICNDYELIYLIKEGNERAEKILYDKYSRYIYSMMNDLNVYKIHYDDFYQEGLMAVMMAIKTYDMESKCSFLSYFYIILKRRFYRYYNYLCGLELPFSKIYDGFREESVGYTDNEVNYYELGLSLLKLDFDKEVYRLLYKLGYTPRMICEILGCDTKKVYNTIQKIKGVLKELKY